MAKPRKTHHGQTILRAAHGVTRQPARGDVGHGVTSVLIYETELVMRGDALSRPVNYSLLRVVPPANGLRRRIRCRQSPLSIAKNIRNMPETRRLCSRSMGR